MDYMQLVFFIYGLAFFILGFGVLVYPKRETGLDFARGLWLVALFGLMHGLNEWIDMFLKLGLLHEVQESFLLMVRTLVLPLSFLFLFFYGINTFIRVKGLSRLLRGVPLVMLAVWLVLTLMNRDEFFLVADIFARYFIAIPGILLTASAFILHLPEIRRRSANSVERYMWLVIMSFVLYAFIAGVIVPEDDFFPANILNYSLFQELMGFPVQVARLVCAVAATYGMLWVLKVFSWQNRLELASSRDILEELVRDRTGALMQLNEELEHEIAEKTEYESELLSSLEEKETLLREINHRVKNNIQIIMSLLKLESRYIQDTAYARLFSESTNRIKTMMTIQERLYASKSLSHVDFSDFLKDLSRVVFRAHSVDVNRIRFSVDADDITLTPDTAIPAGLVVHELIVNSLVHGFAGKDDGEISIAVRKTGETEFELEYRDTGSGLPGGFSLGEMETLGLELVKALTREQLHGSVEARNEGGAVFVIRFTDIKYRQRI